MGFGVGVPNLALISERSWIKLAHKIQKLIEFAVFTARRSYASAVLGVVILSVRLSVRHTRAL